MKEINGGVFSTFYGLITLNMAGLYLDVLMIAGGNIRCLTNCF